MCWEAHRARVFPAKCRLSKEHPAGVPPMSRLPPRPLKVERDFTDARLTGFGGWSALAPTAERLGLFGDLSEGVSVKVRCLGASDGEFQAKASEADLAGFLEASRRPVPSCCPKSARRHGPRSSSVTSSVRRPPKPPERPPPEPHGPCPEPLSPWLHEKAYKPKIQTANHYWRIREGLCCLKPSTTPTYGMLAAQHNSQRPRTPSP